MINSDVYEETSEDSIDAANPFSRAMKVASPTDVTEKDEGEEVKKLVDPNNYDDEFAKLHEIEERANARTEQ